MLGTTVVSFTAFDPHAPAQYIQQWSGSVQKSLGHDTTIEMGYHGERGFHLQRSDLINNDLPGPGTLQPRRPFPTATFLPGTIIPSNVTSTSLTFPVSTVNNLEDTAKSWYDAGIPLPEIAKAREETASTAVAIATGYSEGMLVDHEKYGRGRITEISGHGIMRKLKIRFPGGERAFIADKAKLTIVSKG